MADAGKGDGARLYKNRWFDKFARKERISDAMLCEAVERADGGEVW